jgi:DNA-binding MarR family transcriptional regulator
MDSAQRQPREQPLGPPLIGTLLRRPAEALRGRLLGELHAAGFSDLAESHLAVLRYPGPDGRRPSDLAADTGMTRQAMNYLLGHLQKAGYLTRRGDGGDQRSRRIDLTGRGHAALRAIQQAVSGIEAELEQELGPAQMTQLRSLLIKLNTTQAVRHAHSRATRRPTVQRDQRRQSGSLELPAAACADGADGVGWIVLAHSTRVHTARHSRGTALRYAGSAYRARYRPAVTAIGMRQSATTRAQLSTGRHPHLPRWGTSRIAAHASANSLGRFS